jgi:branched-chain amino acid transport system substrate-binding protein
MRRTVKVIAFGTLACTALLWSAGSLMTHAAEPIRVGAVLSITGWAGSLGTPEKEALEIEVEKVNRQGGILGRQLELQVEDDQSNPTNSAIAATKLIRDRKVSSVIGSTLTVMCMSMLPIVESEQVLNVSLGAGHEITFPLKKWIFRIPPTDILLSPYMLKFAATSFGAKRIALLHATDASGMMGAKGIRDNVAKYGASIVITEKFDPKDTSMIPQLTKIRAANPDVILLYASAPPAIVIAKNYQQLGIDTRVIGSHGIPTPDFLAGAGKAVENGRWVMVVSKVAVGDKMPVDDPYRKNIYEPFLSDLKRKFGKAKVHPFHSNAYDGIHVVMEALKIAGTDDRAALRDAMEKVSFNGLLASYKYSPTDHDGIDIDRTVLPIVVRDGEFWPYKER